MMKHSSLIGRLLHTLKRVKVWYH